MRATSIAAHRAVLAILPPAAVLLATLLICPPALAQETILRLTETATVLAAPDELEASLRAEATAPTAADAQKRVNDMMRDALETAKKISGIVVSTGGYNVWRNGPTAQDRNERWQAGQTLSLTGKDAEAMLRLVGDLQQKGLIEASLNWRLSREVERHARQAATKQALSALRGRAEEAAALLDLRFDAFREVRVDAMTPPMMPRRIGVQRAMPAMAAAPPPSAESEDLPVTATAEATIALKPR